MADFVRGGVKLRSLFDPVAGFARAIDLEPVGCYSDANLLNVLRLDLILLVSSRFVRHDARPSR